MRGRGYQVDRFLVPEGAPGVERYLLDALWAPHGVRERLVRAMGRLAGGRAIRLLGGRPDPAWRSEIDALEEVLASPLAAGLPVDRGRFAWLLLRGYVGRRRHRTTAFLFADGADEAPAAVVKLRSIEVGRNDSGPSLAAERDALMHLDERLSGVLAGTVPPVLGHGCAGGREALLLRALSGRPAYVEVRGALSPGRRAGAHFRAAAEWLARFHHETAGAAWAPPPPEEIGLPEPAPPWYRRLAEAAEAGRLPRVATHGDFWARNLLVADAPETLPAVVDWEGFEPAAGCHHDLFHFLLSYARIVPACRPRDPLEEFDRMLFGAGPLARAVAGYLRIYTRRRGLDPELLEPLFRLELRCRARRAMARSGPPDLWDGSDTSESGETPGRGRHGRLPWTELERRFDVAWASRRGGERSVFSG